MNVRRFACHDIRVLLSPDPEKGEVCLYEDVEPLLERIKELERQLEFERSLGDWM